MSDAKQSLLNKNSAFSVLSFGVYDVDAARELAMVTDANASNGCGERWDDL
jgi:hypothetical protein